MKFELTDQAVKQREDEARRLGFDRWLNMPTTKILVSMIPTEVTVETVLCAAFEAGFASGKAQVAVEMVARILLKKKD